MMGAIFHILVKIIIWFFIIGFGSNFLMQTISYSFYKRAKKSKEITSTPIMIQYNDQLSGYGVNLLCQSDHIILFFGGSGYTAYNAVGKFGDKYTVPFLSVDYYGTQGSKGRMNLKSMQQTAIDAFDWVRKNYMVKKIVVIGHSYGTGIATYLASKRHCEYLFLLAAYRDCADLYNKIIPIFHGLGRKFILQNIKLADYAKEVHCSTYIIGSKTDKTLNVALQLKVKDCFDSAQIIIFNNIAHEDYMTNIEVINFINEVLGKTAFNNT